MGNSRAAAGRKQRPRQATAPAALPGSPLPWPGSVGQEGHRLQGADLEGFAAADVGAGQLFVASYHVRLCLGELGAVALVGAAGQLGPLAPDDPGDLVLARLPALGTGQRVGALLGRLVEVVAFFHGLPSLHPGNKAPSPRTACLTSWRRKPVAGDPGLSLRQDSFHTMLAMTKRKPDKFSATKAVKANARERVGQPKPVRVIDSEPRTGRATKHKPKLEEIIRQEE